MTVLAQSQFSIRRLIDGKTVNFFLNSNKPVTQIYTPDPPTFMPNWAGADAGSALVITPDLQISGQSGSQVSKFKSGSVAWKINGVTITGTNATYGATAATSAPYSLTINKNMADVSQLDIECSAIYVDPITKSELPVKQTIAFTKVTNSGASIIAVCNAPQGIIFKNDMVASLKATCDMWRGAEIDNTDVVYKWSILVGGSYVVLTKENESTYGITGYTTREITIPSSAVLNYAVFKCEITDKDAGSSTYNKTVADTISFTDLSDPYQIVIDLPKGDGVPSGGSVTAKVDVYQGANKMADSFFTGKTCRFFRYNAQGVLDTSWGTAGYKTGRSITIAESDLHSTYQTVFGCEINV